MRKRDLHVSAYERLIIDVYAAHFTHGIAVDLKGSDGFSGMIKDKDHKEIRAVVVVIIVVVKNLLLVVNKIICTDQEQRRHVAFKGIALILITDRRAIAPGEIFLRCFPEVVASGFLLNIKDSDAHNANKKNDKRKQETVLFFLHESGSSYQIKDGN